MHATSDQGQVVDLAAPKVSTTSKYISLSLIFPSTVDPRRPRPSHLPLACRDGGGGAREVREARGGGQLRGLWAHVWCIVPVRWGGGLGGAPAAPAGECGGPPVDLEIPPRAVFLMRNVRFQRSAKFLKLEGKSRFVTFAFFCLLYYF